MRKSLLLLTFFLFFISTNLLAGINEGLVAYYRFDGNAQDLSGYGNHGQVRGATLTTGRLGTPNSAYLFNGNDNYIFVNDSPSLHINNQITVSCWFYNYDTSTNRPFATKRFKEAGFSLRTEYWPRFNVGSSYFNEVAAPDIQLSNKWSQLTGTYDGQAIKLFLDGSLIATKYHPNQLVENSDPLYIGVYKSGDEEVIKDYFWGAIDEIRIYNRCLSEEEVQNLYLSDNSPADNLKALIDNVLKLNIQSGISNSLDSKLETAIKALDDNNINNDPAVVNSLQAFINACLAQRGKNISVEAADYLIMRANEIIALIDLK